MPHTHTHARTHARTRMRACTHTHTHTHTDTQCIEGLMYSLLDAVELQHCVLVLISRVVIRADRSRETYSTIQDRSIHRSSSVVYNRQGATVYIGKKMVGIWHENKHKRGLVAYNDNLTIMREVSVCLFVRYRNPHRRTPRFETHHGC